MIIVPKILDTFKLDNGSIPYLSLHLQRVQKTIQLLQTLHQLKIEHDLESRIESTFKKVAKDHSGQQKGRILISLDPFDTTYSVEPLGELQIPIQLSFCQYGHQRSGLGLWNYKTTERSYWEQNQKLIGDVDQDVIGINDLGEITETSRFSIFVKENDTFCTPPLSSGCLAGVFREHVLASTYVQVDGQSWLVRERTLLKEDLINGQIFVGNSVRGLLPARMRT